MKRLNTMISYDELFSLAKRGGKAQGTPAFIKLFKPALLEMSDDEIAELTRGTTFWFGAHLFTPIKWEAIHILIIQEYVKRVEKSEEEERLAQERLEELKKEVRKEDWHRQIVEKEDSSILNNLELKSIVDKKMRANEALARRNLDEHLRWTAIYEVSLHKFIYKQERRRQAPEERFKFGFTAQQHNQFIIDDLVSDYFNWSNDITNPNNKTAIDNKQRIAQALRNMQILKGKEKKK